MALWSAAYQVALDNAMRAQMEGLSSEDGAKRHAALQEVKHVAKACANTAVCDFEHAFEGP